MSSTDPGPGNPANKKTNIGLRFDEPLFDAKDYFPFAIGVIILGGVIVIPVIWNLAFWFDWGECILWSLTASIIFMIPFARDGALHKFSFYLTVTALVGLFLVYSVEWNEDYMLTAAVFWIIAYILSGGIGMFVGRLIRRFIK